MKLNFTAWNFLIVVALSQGSESDLGTFQIPDLEILNIFMCLDIYEKMSLLGRDEFCGVN